MRINYEDATNKGLNIALAKRLGWKIHPMPFINELHQKIGIESKDSIHIIKGDDHRIVDFCTDWNATMPLAIEHKISIRWLDGVNCWVSDQVFDNQCGVYSSFSSYQLETGGEILEQTPLRAIVISLIKVLEAKK